MAEKDFRVKSGVIVGGSAVTTSSSTFSLINDTATTLNIGGAATAINMGVAAGSITIASPTINLNGANPTLATNQTTGTLTLFNTNIPTVTAFNGATTVNIHNSTGATVVTNIATAASAVDKTINIGTGGGSGTSTTVDIGTADGGASSVYLYGEISLMGNVGVAQTLTLNTIDTGTVTTTANLFNTNATAVNAFGAATSYTVGATTATGTIRGTTITLPNATTLNVNGANPTVASSSTGTLTLFNTNLTTVNAFGAATTATLLGAATTLTIGGASAAQTISIGGSSTGASTYNFGTGATGSATTKTVNIGTGAAASSTTNINIGSSNGGTYTVNSPTVTLASATTLNINGANPTVASSSTGTLTLFNTNIATVNEFGAAATITIGNTITAAQTVTIGGSSTGASTYNFGTGATANATTKTINIGTGGASGSTTNINLGSSNGGTVTVNSGLTITGNLTVNGTTTTVNSTIVSVDDINIILGDIASPTDTTANGGGITLKGATDKTFNWVQSTAAWTSSEHIAVAAGKDVIIGGATSGTITLRAAATAGSNVITFPASTGTVLLDGTGVITSTMILDGTIVNADISASAAIALTKLASDTTTALGVGTIELGHASDTTLSRGAAGRLNVEGVNVPTISSTDTLTNKSIALGSNTITGTKAQFDTALTDDNFAFIGTANTFTANQAITGTLTARAAATQDGIILQGRAGGTTTLGVTITPTTLTASRTLTLPNVDGTVITTGDTGTVTSTMIADGTIVDADINASAAIAHSKLANMTAGRVLLGNASNVPTATDVTGDVTITSGGVTAIATGVIVNADINASAAIALTKLASDTTTALGVGTVELGHASDTTLSRSAAGRLAVEGVNVPTISSTDTLTNKSIALGSNTVTGTKAQFDTALTDDNFAFVGTANAFTANQTITGTLTAQAAATQDSVILQGRAGGTSSRSVTLIPTTLTASRTLTLPDVDGTVFTTAGGTYTGSITLRAGTTAAGTAPLYLTSGTNLTAPVAGAVEWDGSLLYVTSTTGPTRNTVAYRDNTSLNAMLPSQSSNAGRYLTTDGTNTSWATASGAVTTFTLSANTETVVDAVAKAGVGAIEYTVFMQQGTGASMKTRVSKLLILHNSGITAGETTSVDSTEYAVMENNGAMAGVSLVGKLDTVNNEVEFRATVTDAATTNVTIKFSKTVIS